MVLTLVMLRTSAESSSVSSAAQYTILTSSLQVCFVFLSFQLFSNDRPAQHPLVHSRNHRAEEERTLFCQVLIVKQRSPRRRALVCVRWPTATCVGHVIDEGQRQLCARTRRVLFWLSNVALLVRIIKILKSLWYAY